MKKKLFKLLLYILTGGLAFFVVTFTVYFFNLDMKLIVNVIAPMLEKYHDKKHHDQYV